MEIKNIFGESIQVTDLIEAITEANTCLGIAKEAAKKVGGVKYIVRNGKEFTLIEFHSHNLNELLKLLPHRQYPDWLFVGVFPTCYIYCDKRVNVNNDFKEILRLYYDPIRIEIKAENNKGYPEIVAMAKEQLKWLQARVNEPLKISVTGQTASLSLSVPGEEFKVL